ncbi:o-succinylbenzoate synthase [Aurantibacter crassamenti]|uniref:o-succinylbenzoate synthase n=1 Tax=Aurantibacter crassamenti TaxID=1837375 RepID=UPI00193A964F|nr:o-succinylbenzoate synthase [Aurantibacter crassamenti]MBM1107415.1 o-succinylbenzoate synthase [Aurantibacter crassamenti]
MKASYKKHIIDFKKPSGTSRGVLIHKETWYLTLHDDDKFGIGECGLLQGLSIDDVPEYEQKLQWTCDNIHLGTDVLWHALINYPSIQFGVEQAFLSFESSDPFKLFSTDFTEEEKTIPINGLVWMGDFDFMNKQIQQKLAEGFQCIKLKIGAIDFNQEIKLLDSLRKNYSKEILEIRVDANGAFSSVDALEKLHTLATFGLHSIEQPIQPGDYVRMNQLCQESPLPIALDEELIGITDKIEKEEMLRAIRPQYIILKPSLIGGFHGCEEWISLAEKYNIGWWVTSALESNIGLNAISQWTYTLNNNMPQGLGTGALYTNNIESPLTVENGHIYYSQSKKWNTKKIEKVCI